MRKSTLMTIGDIIHNLDGANKELYDMLELINLADDEMSKVVDSIFVLSDKIERIKQSKLNELSEHIDIDYIENTMRY